MKKRILLFIIPFAALLISSCDTGNNPITTKPQGSIYVSSNPANAQIWLDGINTLKTTTDTVKNVSEGVHSVTLKLQDYRDTTFSVSVSGGQTSVVTNVRLISNIMTALYGSVRIYETIGTSSSQPSGLDLSTGTAHGVSSAENGLVDIYYSSSGFLVQSASLYPNLVRVTKFYIASGTILSDGQDAPLITTGTWTDNIGDRENNYVFLYDNDNHYSKLKIVNWGGGNPGDPAWIEVQWYYNKTVQDNRF